MAWLAAVCPMCHRPDKRSLDLRDKRLGVSRGRNRKRVAFELAIGRASTGRLIHVVFDGREREDDRHCVVETPTTQWTFATMRSNFGIEVLKVAKRFSFAFRTGAPISRRRADENNGA